MAARGSSASPEDTATHQPMLEGLELPDYHGRKPSGMKTKLSGAGSRISRSHSIGDRVVLVIEGVVKAAGHEQTDDGLLYVESLRVDDLFELDRDPGARLLSTLRSAYRTASDAAAGRQALDGLGEVGYTDASGVVMTAEEVAALRGDPTRVLVSDSLTPAVIVYDDQSRELWPDDFEKDAPRPFLGQQLERSGETREVVDLLHHATGEPIGARPAAQPPASTTKPKHAGDAPDIGAEAAAAEKTRRAELDSLRRDQDTLPTTADFEFVAATPTKKLRERLAADVTTLEHARRLVRAEEQGRGVGAAPRKDALAMLRAHVAKLEGSAS